jgi:hypothetical protein
LKQVPIAAEKALILPRTGGRSVKVPAFAEVWETLVRCRHKNIPFVAEKDWEVFNSSFLNPSFIGILICTAQL